MKTEDVLFIQELYSLGKTADGARILRTSPMIANKILQLHDKYGKKKVFQTIKEIKTHEHIQED